MFSNILYYLDIFILNKTMFFVQKFIIIIFLLRSGVNKDSIPDYPLTDQCTYTNLFQKYFILYLSIMKSQTCL
jgi:hypothetical protein